MAITEREFNPNNNPDIDAIKKGALEFEEIITRHAPATRRRSIALTNLETAAMFAVKAAARGDD